MVGDIGRHDAVPMVIVYPEAVLYGPVHPENVHFLVEEHLYKGNIVPHLLALMHGKEDFPSYGNMIRNGATTIWEEWDGDNSQIHNTMISAGLWFIEGLAGIRYDEKAPGFRHFIAAPGVESGLKRVDASLTTGYGKIASAWRVAGDTLTATTTYRNVGVSPMTIQSIGITVLPPDGGPRVALGPTRSNVIVPGRDTVELAGARFFSATEPVGTWEIHAAYVDALGVRHDAPSRYFTVSAASTVCVAKTCAGVGCGAIADGCGGPKFTMRPVPANWYAISMRLSE